MGNEENVCINPSSLEMNYDPNSRELHLKHVEPVSGRLFCIQFDAQATRAIYDCLLEVAKLTGEPLGAKEIIPKSKH
ncbi:hypothetical protein ACSVIJ_16155 [Pseudomonas sp. NCHU5208]|uniref:hypothetical protein n=1 Tax=unclassified Pseudomonas TaxID=196821 RepID=UPI003F992692